MERNLRVSSHQSYSSKPPVRHRQKKSLEDLPLDQYVVLIFLTGEMH